MLQVATELRATLNPDLPFDHFRRIEEAMGDLYRDVTRSIAASMIDRFKSGFEHLETKDDNDGFYERIWQEYLNQYGGTRIAQISETTRRQIVALIDKGLRDGLSLDEIAGEIRMRAPDMSALRAHTIARTETHSASMYASLQSAKQSTVELLKEWVSVEDSRTRDFGEGDGVVDFYDHRSMNGVKVPIDDPFEVPNKLGGSEKLMFPGDPAGSAANIINCRCGQVYVDTDEDEVEDDVPPAIEATAPAFRYKTIKDPEPTEDAFRAFIISNGIAKKADFSGVDYEKVAPHLRQFLEVKERFDLDPMWIVGPIENANPNWLGDRRPLASFYPAMDELSLDTGPNFMKPTGTRGIWNMPKQFGDDETWARQNFYTDKSRKEGTYLEMREAAVGYLDEDLTVRLDRSRESASFGFTVEDDMLSPATFESRKAATVYHEFGHVVHLANTKNPGMSEAIDTFNEQVVPHYTGWSYLLSDYASTNEKEYVAEAFSLYMRGDVDEFYRIHPDLLSIFQQYDRGAL